MIDSFLEDTNFKKYFFKGASYEYKGKIRFTLDYKEDLKLFKFLFNKFGIYEKRKTINDYLRKNKKILNINFFKNKLWEKKQKNFKLPKKND
jgi:spore coat polysaccharide biosynthesis protein SpsF (cytidylyltransferase family)